MQVDKLIVFAGRKSLTNWQRAVLENWITSSMNTLEAMGLVDNQLLDSLARLQAAEFDIDIDEQSELSAAEQLREAMTQRMHEELFDDEDDEFDFESDEEFEDESDEEDFDFGAWYRERLREAGLDPDDVFADDELDEPAQTGGANTDTTKAEDSQTLFKTLFHRVARALHPDKIADPEEREAKQALMSSLLEARRNQDVMSVFELYREHVDADAEFAEQELAQLESVLHQFIARQHELRTELTMQSHTHHMAYEYFYNKNSTVVERNIKRKLRDIKKQKAQIDSFTDTVSSLKALKPYLEHRYDDLLTYY